LEHNLQNCRAGNFLHTVETENSRIAYLEHNHPQFLYNTDKQQHTPFATDAKENQFKQQSRPYFYISRFLFKEYRQ
jgi:hypothetical protein